MKRRNLIIAILLVIILAAAAWLLLRRTNTPAAVAPTVTVMPAWRDNVQVFGEYVGRVRAQQFVEVRARVEGYLEQMCFDEGSTVRKGQRLFVIDPATYRARAARAAAQLRSAEAAAEKARRDLERIRPLYEQNAASRLDLDNAEAANETAAATVAMCRADLEQARRELSYTTVTAPLTGKISERRVDLGTLVGPGAKSLLATIVKSDTVLIDFSMTALDYLRSKSRNVELGQQDASRSWQPVVTVTVADNSVYPYQGIVDFAEPQVDPKTGTFSVRAELPNPDNVLLPGQATRVRLLLDVVENATVIPVKSTIIEKGGAHIFVMRPDSTVERRFVELGAELDNAVVVNRGLNPGELVVVEGQHKLRPGERVRPVEATSSQVTDSINATEAAR